MKVHYTIPGWEPAPVAGARAGAAEGVGFETRLKEASAAMPTASREILGLDRPRPGEMLLAPPQRPASLAYFDLDEERRIWRGMLDRHAGPGPMFALLAEIQQAEDEIAARTLVDSRG
jgi:hypothetical protein